MLGTQIRRFRKANGMNQDELASALNISRQSLSSWEGGKTSPSVSSLSELADLFHCTTDTLLGRNSSSYYIPTSSLTDEQARLISALVESYEQLNKKAEM